MIVVIVISEFSVVNIIIMIFGFFFGVGEFFEFRVEILGFDVGV